MFQRLPEFDTRTRKENARVLAGRLRRLKKSSRLDHGLPAQPGDLVGFIEFLECDKDPHRKAEFGFRGRIRGQERGRLFEVSHTVVKLGYAGPDKNSLVLGNVFIGPFNKGRPDANQFANSHEPAQRGIELERSDGVFRQGLPRQIEYPLRIAAA